MVVSFDRGDGGDPAARTLESGTYRVGLGGDSKALDLIPVEGRSEAPSPSPGTAGGSIAVPPATDATDVIPPRPGRFRSGRGR